MRRLGIVTALAALTLTSCSSTSSGSDDPDEDTRDDIAAEVMCEEFVKDKLKAPSTAEFTDQDATSTGQQRWDVTGAVDSQNGFGAMIRSTYRCDIRYLGDDQWRAKTVTVD